MPRLWPQVASDFAKRNGLVTARVLDNRELHVSFQVVPPTMHLLDAEDAHPSTSPEPDQDEAATQPVLLLLRPFSSRPPYRCLLWIQGRSVSGRSTRHIELELPEGHTDYTAGDHLAVYGGNNIEVRSDGTKALPVSRLMFMSCVADWAEKPCLIDPGSVCVTGGAQGGGAGGAWHGGRGHGGAGRQREGRHQHHTAAGQQKGFTEESMGFEGLRPSGGEGEQVLTPGRRFDVDGLGQGRVVGPIKVLTLVYIDVVCYGYCVPAGASGSAHDPDVVRGATAASHQEPGRRRLPPLSSDHDETADDAAMTMTVLSLTTPMVLQVSYLAELAACPPEKKALEVLGIPRRTPTSSSCHS